MINIKNMFFMPIKIKILNKKIVFPKIFLLSLVKVFFLISWPITQMYLININDCAFMGNHTNNAGSACPPRSISWRWVLNPEVDTSERKYFQRILSTVSYNAPTEILMFMKHIIGVDCRSLELRLRNHECIFDRRHKKRWMSLCYYEIGNTNYRPQFANSYIKQITRINNINVYCKK